jgi:hypothetical protein
VAKGIPFSAVSTGLVKRAVFKHSEASLNSMRRPIKIALWIATPFALLIAGGLLYFFVLLDWNAKPYCEKQITLAVRLWTHDQNPNLLPNVEGSSFHSMASMAEQLVTTNIVLRDYQYVPGLQQNDPGDLVLIYFNQPTHWRMHIRPEGRWKPKHWLVMPIAALEAGVTRQAERVGHATHQVLGFGEQGELLSTEQFTNRLLAALDYLRTNNRPHWQAIVKEHTAFIDSLSKDK